MNDTEEVKKVLTLARELIANGWTQDSWARNEAFFCVDPMSPTASCYCLGGALLKAGQLLMNNPCEVTDRFSGEIRDPLYRPVALASSRLVFSMRRLDVSFICNELNYLRNMTHIIPGWNDKHSKNEVLNLIDETLNQIEKEESNG